MFKPVFRDCTGRKSEKM